MSSKLEKIKGSKAERQITNERSKASVPGLSVSEAPHEITSITGQGTITSIGGSQGYKATANKNIGPSLIQGAQFSFSVPMGCSEAPECRQKRSFIVIARGRTFIAAFLKCK